MGIDVETGDVVKLRSGGPEMTVEALIGQQVSCVWFAGEDSLRQAFDRAVLTSVIHVHRAEDDQAVFVDNFG